jgi:regulator of nucleoside diphosphate kinase
MTKRSVYMTEYDLRRLQPLVEAARRYERADFESLDLLQQELDRAILCALGELPADVVSVNSQVLVTDLESGKKAEYTIVFPRDANYEDKRISVLAPIGTALLGYRTGAEVEWPTPGGLRRFRIERVKRTARRRVAAKIA